MSLIPGEERHPVDELQEFKITFGPVRAELGMTGNYQGYGSTQERPRFWVEKETIERYLPESEAALNQLYPYYCPDEHIAKLDAEIRSGDKGKIGEKGRFLAKIGRHKDAVGVLDRLFMDTNDQELLYFLIASCGELGMKAEQGYYMRQVSDPKPLSWLNGKTFSKDNVISPPPIRKLKLLVQLPQPSAGPALTTGAIVAPISKPVGTEDSKVAPESPKPVPVPQQTSTAVTVFAKKQKHPLEQEPVPGFERFMKAWFKLTMFWIAAEWLRIGVAFKAYLLGVAIMAVYFLVKGRRKQ